MIIDDNFEIKDDVSGLHIMVIPKKNHNRIRITKFKEGGKGVRDFYFTDDGMFDSTGSITNKDLRDRHVAQLD